MPTPWWKDGVRFECQGSGRCCLSRGSHGFVYLTLEDRRRLARHLGLSTSAFSRKYCQNTDGWFHLRPEDPSVKSPTEEHACRFLKNHRCSVYEARPTQCRTWPFWPENMNPKAWAKEVGKFCPGVGKGRLHSAGEIRAMLKQDPLSEGDPTERSSS